MTRRNVRHKVADNERYSVLDYVARNVRRNVNAYANYYVWDNADRSFDSNVDRNVRDCVEGWLQP